MRIPNKKPEESSSEYMDRCMVSLYMIGQYPKKEQRMAICAVQERKDREHFDGK
jgi:hypothetical protein